MTLSPTIKRNRNKEASTVLAIFFRLKHLVTSHLVACLSCRCESFENLFSERILHPNLNEVEASFITNFWVSSIMGNHEVMGIMKLLTTDECIAAYDQHLQNRPAHHTLLHRSGETTSLPTYEEGTIRLDRKKLSLVHNILLLSLDCKEHCQAHSGRDGYSKERNIDWIPFLQPLDDALAGNELL